MGGLSKPYRWRNQEEPNRKEYRTNSQLKKALCENIYEAPTEFWQRDLEKPYFIVVGNELKDGYIINTENNLRDVVFDFSGGCFVLNLTWLFHHVDESLARLRDFDVYKARAKRTVLEAAEKAFRPDRPAAPEEGDDDAG